MRELTYASKTFVTTDDVTDALLALVTAIDRQEHSEAVCVPAFTAEGELTEALMTLDASSEVVALPIDVEITHDDDAQQAIEAAIADIRSRINRNKNATQAKAIADAGEPELDLDAL